MGCYSKKFCYVIIFLLNFLTGVEYALILPTALQYLRKFGGTELDLGFCISAYSFSSLFSSPIMGKWSDITRNTKQILLFSNLFQIAGSFMYFVGISTMFLIGGRLVAGIGLGVLSCTFSDIIKNTNLDERSSILSKIMIGRQLGLIVGPAFNFILFDLNYQIGPFLLDKLSAPGLMMTIAWILLQIIILFFYKNLHEFNEINNNNHNNDETTPILNNISTSSRKNYDSINNESKIINSENINESSNQISIVTENDRNNENLLDNDDEKNKLLNSSNLQINSSENVPIIKQSKQSNLSENVRIVDNSETDPFYIRFYNEYIRDEVVAVYSVCFTVFFMQTALETLLTPFTNDYFGWSDLQNSVLYAVCGVEIVIIFLVLSYFTKKISDRVLLLLGLILNLLTLVFLIVYIPSAQMFKNEFLDYVLFIVPVFLNVLSLPLMSLGSISLLSKVTSLETQGLTQGLRRTVVGLACILGPNWSGAFYKQWYILFGSLIGLIAWSMIMTTISFSRLNVKKQENANSHSSDVKDSKNINDSIS